MLVGTCHCGAVRWTFRGESDRATACNCSLCRRLGWRLIYGTRATIRVEGPTVGYAQGDRSLAVHHCPTCGCATHWDSAEGPEATEARMAVNLNLADPATVAHVRVRRFDGADTWEFLD